MKVGRWETEIGESQNEGDEVKPGWNLESGE